MDRRFLIAGGGAAFAGLAGYVVLGASSGTQSTITSTSAHNPSGIDTSGILDMAIGNPHASVTMIEYASFTCPHCRAFHMGPFKQLKADFIDTRKINFVHREVFFDRFGLWAAIVARCGEGAENRYFGIADLIYERQQQWAGGGNSPQQVVAQLRNIGKMAGLTDEQLDSCFADADNAEALWAYFERNAQADGINATPSFVINGRKYRNMAYADLKQTIESKLPS